MYQNYKTHWFNTKINFFIWFLIIFPSITIIIVDFKLEFFFEPDIQNLFGTYYTKNLKQIKCILLIISKQFTNMHSF